MATKLDRVFRALARRGLEVTREDLVYKIRLKGHLETAEVLLPEDLPLEEKAVRQLADLVTTHHPEGGGVEHACAMPDFHPGSAGIPIGTVLVTKDIVIPGAVGSDINCGMRLHYTSLDEGTFLSKKDELVNLLKGDYLLGTRNVVMHRTALQALFEGGVLPWLEEAQKHPMGLLEHVRFEQLEEEALGHSAYCGGLDCNDLSVIPEKLLATDIMRPDDLGTIGRGNHFCEVQVVDAVLDRGQSWTWFGSTVQEGSVFFMVHSGSRMVGKALGSYWADKARRAWPEGVKFPESKIFPLLARGPLFNEYMAVQAAAANYGFLNRVLLGEMWRRRMRDVYGHHLECSLIGDAPHNLVTKEGTSFVTRKGSCSAAKGATVIIPGSMGTSSYLCVGLGNPRFYNSASHGAGRASSRGKMRSRDDLGMETGECITLREERRMEEAPSAYKPIDPVIQVQVQAGNIKPVLRLRPLLTFKA